MTRDEQDEAEWRSPHNWHGGFLGLYYSRRDSRAFVPKREGELGSTINFARASGVLWLTGLLVFAGILAAVAIGA